MGGVVTGTGALSQAVAGFAAGHPAADLPAPVLAMAGRSLLNMLATAIAGCDDPAIAACRAVLAQFSGAGVATVFGRGDRLDLPTAAFLNAAAANVFDFDDTHIPTIIHPTAPVAPVVLALAQAGRVSGRDLLAALAIGMEVECRLGVALSPGHYARGWHITATCGVFGAAAGAGRLLGLSQERMLWALAIAAGQSAGMVELLGTHAKSVAVGNAARNGLLAAMMAGAGVSGPPAPLDGALGFLRLYGEPAAPGLLAEGLGSRWEILNNTFKPWPCGVVLNAVVDACLAVRAEPGLAPAAFAAVTVEGNRLLVERTDRPAVSTGRLSQVSAQHAAAVTLLRGAPGLDAFADAAVRDPAVAALRSRVAVRVADDLPLGAARVTVTLPDGHAIGRTVTAAKGSLDAPLSAADIEAKFHRLAAPRLSEARRTALVEAVRTLDRLADARVIADGASP
jgi:2-methylcitrate dehydratase PrpD